jgi:sucrose-6F-phosphate phosphohydrolase
LPRGWRRGASDCGSPTALVASTGLPEPDALIGHVGTHIESYARGERIAGWPRLAGPWDPWVVRQVMATVDGIELQPEEFNSPHKVSYYYHDATGAQLAELQSRLEAAGQAVRIVYSSCRDLDVLPAGLDKGAAAAFLAQHWGVPRERVIVCGDTANDLSMFEQGFRGIVVGNALAELRSLRSPDVYHARGHFAAGVAEGLRHWFERVPQSPRVATRGLSG